METIKLDVTQEMVLKALELALPKVLNDSYDSPIRKCVEAAVKEKQGQISELVSEALNASLTDPEFKKKIGDLVLSKMIETALKK